MHSSRMRSARLLTVSGGGNRWGGSSQLPRGGLPNHGGLPNPGRTSAQPAGSASRGWAESLPPVNRMTHRFKNITLPQTLFAAVIIQKQLYCYGHSGSLTHLDVTVFNLTENFNEYRLQSFYWDQFDDNFPMPYVGTR